MSKMSSNIIMMKFVANFKQKNQYFLKFYRQKSLDAM